MFIVIPGLKEGDGHSRIPVNDISDYRKWKTEEDSKNNTGDDESTGKTVIYFKSKREKQIIDVPVEHIDEFLGAVKFEFDE